MRKLSLLLLTAAAFSWMAQQARAQAMVVYDPVVVPSYPVAAPSVVYETYRPVVTTPWVTRYRPAVRYSYPAPVTTYRPVTAYDPIVSDAPLESYPVVTSYSPVVTYSAPAAYDPVVTSYYAPVVVRPRVFVAGQPVRNFFRAVAP
jgi:hypothetical protein